MLSESIEEQLGKDETTMQKFVLASSAEESLNFLFLFLSLFFFV